MRLNRNVRSRIRIGVAGLSVVAIMIASIIPAAAHTVEFYITPGSSWSSEYHYYNSSMWPYCDCEYNVLKGSQYSSVGATSFHYDYSRWTVHTYHWGVMIGNHVIYNNTTTYFSDHVGFMVLHPDTGVSTNQTVNQWVNFSTSNVLQVDTHFLSMDEDNLYLPTEHLHLFRPG